MSGTSAFFRKNVLAKYKLEPATSHDQPCVLWGMYKAKDYEYLRAHKAPVIIVFRGSDANKIKKFEKGLLDKAVKIYAPGIFISRVLHNYGIKHQVLPLTGCPMDIQLYPKGNCIYHYGDPLGSPTYGNQYLPEIQQRTGLKIIKAHARTYQRQELLNIYRQCFIGLRLTLHDGLPNTVLELGLMGRKCIYNGQLPNSISWKGIDDICENIITEYLLRKENNLYIAKDMKDFLNIGDNWLNI